MTELSTAHRLGVVGGGQMGQGIAQIAAQAGLDVILVDVSPELAAAAIGKLGRTLDKLVEKGKLTGAARDATRARIRAGDNHGSLHDRDFVIEAAPENEALKLAIFKSLGQVTGADTILASNTSSISITRLAAATRRPEAFIGMHFMNPVPVMKLVEIIRGKKTSDATTETIKELTVTLGKVPAVANDFPGFVSNRVLMPMINEAVLCLQEGVSSKEDIDTIMKLGMAHPMGPIALADYIGLDVCLAIMEVLDKGFGGVKYKPAELLRRMVADGKLGVKSGAGFYDYSPR